LPDEFVKKRTQPEHISRSCLC